VITQTISASSIFPSRRTCFWQEQVDGLEAQLCDDGEVTMWRDDQHNVWLPSEPPPARWKKTFRHRNPATALFGAAVSPLPGICTPHKPVPLTKIRRLQNALRGLATRVRDGSLRVTADGLIGGRTVAAVNRAMVTYVGSPGTLATGHLTHAQVSAFASQLTAAIDKAPHQGDQTSPGSASSMPPPVTTPWPAPSPQGAPSMPAYYPQQEAEYYPPQQAYYPQGPAYGYGPTRAPGGLPAGHASLDVKAFVPAQYEHIRVNPTTAMLMVGVGVLAVLLVLDKKKKASA
jgi:hypothetical protein